LNQSLCRCEEAKLPGDYPSSYTSQSSVKSPDTPRQKYIKPQLCLLFCMGVRHYSSNERQNTLRVFKNRVLRGTSGLKSEGKQQVKVQVKQSRNRPGVVQGIPGGLGSQIPLHSAREGGEVVSLTHRPPLPPGSVPGTYFHWGLSLAQGHGAVRRKYITEKSSDTTGNRSRDRQTRRAAPKPLRQPRGEATGGRKNFQRQDSQRIVTFNISF
jgi:hypothetical protein